MGRGNKGHTGVCPNCENSSTSVVSYGTRHLRHYTIGGLSEKAVPYITFRCLEASCCKKTFRYYQASDSVELCGKSIYSKSTQHFVIQKIHRHPIAYNSFQKQIETDFAVKTSISTLYTWAKKAKLIELDPHFEQISVLNTDEKHPLKKKDCT